MEISGLCTLSRLSVGLNGTFLQVVRMLVGISHTTESMRMPPKVSLFDITGVTMKTQSVGQSDDVGAFQALLSPFSDTFSPSFSPSHCHSVSRHQPSIVSHPAPRPLLYLYFSYPLFLSCEIPSLENTQPSS